MTEFSSDQVLYQLSNPMEGAAAGVSYQTWHCSWVVKQGRSLSPDVPTPKVCPLSLSWIQEDLGIKSQTLWSSSLNKARRVFTVPCPITGTGNAGMTSTLPNTVLLVFWSPWWGTCHHFYKQGVRSGTVNMCMHGRLPPEFTGCWTTLYPPRGERTGDNN